MATLGVRAARRGGYESARPDIQPLVPLGARRILDLGCASGALGAAIKARQGAEVVGIELSPVYARDAQAVLDRVVVGDLDTALDAPDDLGTFDCVIAADVLEHLVDPWRVLRAAVALLEPGGVAVVSLPNVRYALTFWALARRGRWPREPAGFFDATHLRWFTLADARDLLEQAGLTVDAVRPSYFFHGWRLSLVRLLGRGVLQQFLAGQYALVGHRAA